MRVLLKEVSMSREYLYGLNFNVMRDFIKKMMEKKFNTRTTVKINSVKAATDMQTYDFEVIGSNGIHAQGLAYFTEFGCTMEISYGKTKIVKKFDKEWAHHVYQALKKQEEFGLSEYKISNCYKADYNDHLKQIRDEKRKFAEIECEENMIK